MLTPMISFKSRANGRILFVIIRCGDVMKETESY